MLSKEEWTRKLMVRLASGHCDVNTAQEAKDWLAGKEPPIEWEPREKVKK